MNTVPGPPTERSAADDVDDSESTAEGEEAGSWGELRPHDHPIGGDAITPPLEVDSDVIMRDKINTMATIDSSPQPQLSDTPESSTSLSASLIASVRDVAVESEDSGDSCDDDGDTEMVTETSQKKKAQKRLKKVETVSLEEDEYELGAVYKHRWVDAQDYLRNWYVAQIVDLRLDAGKFEVKVHYKGWNPKFDEWIDLSTTSADRKRVQPMHTFTQIPINGYRKAAGGILGKDPELEEFYEELTVGSRIDCLDAVNKWYIAEIVDENELQFQISYDGWSDVHNEWMGRRSYRLAPLHKITDPKDPSSRGPGTGKIGASGTSAMSAGALAQVPSSTGCLDGITSSEAYRMQYLSEFKPSLAHEREFRALLGTSKGWLISDMGGDGSCLFRAVSHQVYGTQECHELVRRKCVEYMVLERDFFAAFVSMDFDEYCMHMARNGVWGGNIEIQVIAEMYNCPVNIYAYSDTPMKTFNETSASGGGEALTIRLSYHFNSHYNSIVDPRTHSAQCKEPATAGVAEDAAIERSRRARGSARAVAVAASGGGGVGMTETEQLYLHSVLDISRHAFETNGNRAQAELDAAIQASLEAAKSAEKTEIEKAVALSLAGDLAVAVPTDAEVLAKSMESFEAEELRKAMAASLGVDATADAAAMGPATGGLPAAVSAVMAMGYDEMAVLSAYTMFESQHLSDAKMVENLLQFLNDSQTRMYSAAGDYGDPFGFS